MFKAEENIAITSSPEIVYGVLVDLERYREWNPWVVNANGKAIEGQNVTVTGILNGKKGQYDHKILSCNRPHHFHWCDLGWFTLFIDGQRERWIEETKEGNSQFKVELRVKGPLAWLAAIIYGKAMRQGLKAETEALKVRCETFAQENHSKGSQN